MYGGYIVFGVFNVVCGGSYYGVFDVIVMVVVGLGIVLVFDYYYFVLLVVLFKLVECGVVFLV